MEKGCVVRWFWIVLVVLVTMPFASVYMVVEVRGRAVATATPRISAV